jgi:cell division protein FtsL
MKLTKLELIMLVLLLIVALIFVEVRYVVNPMIIQHEDLQSERDAVQNDVQTIELNMAIAKQNESKRDENLEQIKQLSKRFFAELQKDALLVRTHDMILEQGLYPIEYQLMPIQALPLIPETYTAAELAYELKNLADTYRLLIGEYDDVIITEETDTENTEIDLEGGETTSPIEQYQISFNVRGTYEQLNAYLDALAGLQRSLIVASLNIVPDQNLAAEEPITEEPLPEEILPEEEIDQLLSIQITLNYFGLAKLIPTEDAFNQWDREPFTSVIYSPFKPLPVPVLTVPTTEPTDTIETSEIAETSETTEENIGN